MMSIDIVYEQCKFQQLPPHRHPDKHPVFGGVAVSRVAQDAFHLQCPAGSERQLPADA